MTSASQIDGNSGGLMSPAIKGLSSQLDDVVDPRMLSPLHLSRIKRTTKNNNVDYGSESSEQTAREAAAAQTISDEIEIEGFRFPKNLNSVWAVSKVLNQTKGKLRLKGIEITNTSCITTT